MTMRMIAFATLTSAGLVAAPVGIAANLSGPSSAVSFGAKTADAVDERMKAVYGESHAYKSFFERLKEAVVKDQKMTVARMISYPFQTMVDGETVTLRNRWQFREVYDQVMSVGVLAAIKDQAYENLLVSTAGIGIGSGDLWFADVDKGASADIKIIAINQRGDYGA